MQFLFNREYTRAECHTQTSECMYVHNTYVLETHKKCNIALNQCCICIPISTYVNVHYVHIVRIRMCSVLLYLCGLVIGQVTGVRLTCEPVDLSHQCTVTWDVSYFCIIRTYTLQ